MWPYDLKAERITLSLLDEEHVDRGYYNWMNDKEVTHYLEARHKQWSKDELKNYIRETNADKNNYLFGIFNENREYIGNIKLGPLVERDKRASVGLMIGDKKAWGKGYGLESVKRIGVFGFQDLGLEKITAGCYGSHIASKTIFLKAGYKIEACLRDHIEAENGREDMLMFGLLREEAVL